MNNFNTDLAVELIKTLVDRNRCVTCDLLNEPIVRYPCGHTACKTCSETAEDCLLCLSPPTVSTNSVDTPSSERVKNASHLLCTFQELFNLDVYRRHRLSEQLKLEKQLFPKCIQAPTKYCNKRKSIKDLKDKENSRVSFIAGENISHVSKMDNSINYVQQWLKTNESISRKSNNKLPRKPLGDLNVNEQSFTKHSLVSKVNNNRNSYHKRKHIKIIDSDIKQRLLPKKRKTDSYRELRSSKDNIKFNFNKKSKCENDESGIFVDEEIIIIDSSLTECKDKDELALIAVRKAEESTSSDFISFDESNDKVISKIIDTSNPEIETNSYKVPFYKKSLLHKICNECKVDKNNIENVDNKNNLSVIIDSDKYVTTIKVSQCPVTNVEVVNKQSVQIQTDAHITETNEVDMDEINTNFGNNTEAQRSSLKVLSLLHEKDIKSADMSKEGAKISKLDKNEENNLKNSKDVSNIIPLARDKCLVIEESDTDSDINEIESTIEVTAEVHREETCFDFGVLSALEPNEYETRMKRNTLRGHTPLSTDSSDKENYDPNRMKKQKLCKKNCSKK
ncbi:uncharacterized protein LOC123655901 [Melitaea cinxia]|uniref:uncharacterized protein LOC123655901 n=1 Tax=Melitaea cinxia TaxID=113334 RepID=UPI001E274D99|nr:uncharacterized protein LOC123655901 [Melitaea cinxia]